MKEMGISKLGMALLLCVQLLWTASAFARDYYIHVNVGDNRNSGLLPSDAFATLSYAMRQLTPGDTLYLRSGLYTETVYLAASDYSDGTFTNPITIKSYPNETPVIGNNIAAFTIGGRKWWVFEDLTFQNSMPMTIGRLDTSNLPINNQCISTAENITVRRVRFQHSVNTGIVISCGNQIKIENSIFDNLRSRAEGVDVHGVLLMYQANKIDISGNHFRDIGADGVHLLDTQGSRFTDISIIDNEFEIVRPYRYRDENGNVFPEGQQPFNNVGENAIDIKQGPGPITVSNNRIHGFRPTMPEQDASGSNGDGISIGNQASGITISKNYFYDNVIHLSAGRGNSKEVFSNRNLSIFNNIFEDSADPGIYGTQVPTGVRLSNISNARVHNNTFYNPFGHQGSVMRITYTDDLRLKNNVFKNGLISIDTNSVTNLITNYNAWSGITGNTFTGEIDEVLLGANDVVVDNLGIDLLTWSPMESSPLIDSGTFVGIVNDYYGAEVVNSISDIGAVEYQPQDTGVPSALIISPADGSTASGDIQVVVVASDDVGVTKVTFAVDGSWAGRDLTAPYTFDWNTSLYADGVREVQATAFDVDGNKNTHTINITVDSLNDIQKPSVLITGPGDGATVSGNVQISAAASDNIGVDKVIFAIDGVWVGNDTTAPYTFTWNTTTYASGPRKIEATAFDLVGNKSKHIVYVTSDNDAPDPQPPSVVITGPGDGATVSGNVQISAAASDNIGVDKVNFAIDGVWVGNDTTAPYTFTWNTTTYANGPRKIEATAFDLVGNKSKHIVYVTSDNDAPDPQPPSVVITGPGDGATVSGNVQLSAAASDNIGVDKVNFAIDGVWVGNDTTAPYTFTWNTTTYANGPRKIEATAFDLVGNKSKHIVYVTSDNDAPDPQPPSVVITGPGDGATVSGNVQISAAASDNIGVDKVIFAIDGVWVGNDTTAPYTFTWNTTTYASGPQKIEATAFDLVGNTRRHIHYVTVNN